MTIYAVRHNKTLEWNNKLVIAPRQFVVDDKIRYVHICSFNCEYVLLYDHLVYRKSYLNNYKTIVQVAKANYLKLHSNTKGLYFNYSYWINNYKKKTIRVYLCE